MANYKIDITKEHCPMTFVKTKIELAKLKEGDRLEVLVSEGEPLENIPKSSEEQGFKVISVSKTEKQGIHLIIIQK
jgi:tRNA 2-thiouridine synthesizing protein A